ncbi:MAG TPA: SigB/SigF/SigG family RNA polymerase sigma factor [Segeticoccus sp.]|uniref:SigB/SigF/SigG family RNA polymerase sigma factor n=1 Tax=Segeticoccus sp. TaxID=2706531 RepID=UPI002D807220|nr:SigB/SigF/SigG family RNA polymerase sigma factor [Segeticoccus sp.]HET8601119.1 SigB/SigF/SigG family RNA polymerase sigma factor [Segeticoccus sp.]
MTASAHLAGGRHELGAGSHEPGSIEERLAEAAAAPTEAEREEILAEVIVDQLPMARSIALRYRDRGQPLEDLVQVASLALVLAVKRFRPEESASFAAFATPTITGELRRYFRDHGWTVRPPRRLQELRPRIVAATGELEQELRRAPTVAELADYLDVPAEEVLEAQVASSSYRHLSLDRTSAPGQDDSLGEEVGEADERLELVLKRVALPQMVATLSDRDRKVLDLRFVHEYTQQQVADEIGVTQMQVSRILSRIRREMRQLAANG